VPTIYLDTCDLIVGSRHSMKWKAIGVLIEVVELWSSDGMAFSTWSVGLVTLRKSSRIVTDARAF